MARTTGNQHDKPVKLSSLFTPAEVLAQTSIGSRDELLTEMLKRLAHRRDIGSFQDAYQAILTRENAGATVVGPGVALPHARLDAISDLAIALATSPTGIDFGGRGVKVVVLILVPKTQPAAYLQTVSSLTALCQDPHFAETVSALKTSEEVWRFFDRGGAVLPPVVCAGDIMETDWVSLHEHDTLEQAIDTMVHHNLVDVPVIDADGDLVGFVSAYELLRVCLPDYVLWVEDLRLIMNFEPFAGVLRNERRTWLAEIMSRDVPAVAEDAPAIQVGKEIAKRTARQVYVVRGKRLVGVVTVQSFLNKVLRE